MSDKASFQYHQRAKASLKPRKGYSHTPGSDIEYVRTPREDLPSHLKFPLRLNTYYPPPLNLTVMTFSKPSSVSATEKGA
jgi:hypothetical protein